MARKIYDVKPPKVANKVENAIKALEKSAVKNKASTRKKAVKKQPVLQQPIVQEAKRSRQSQATIPSESLPSISKVIRKRGFPVKEIVMGSIVIFVLVGIYFFNTLPKADIEISPKTDAISLQEKVTVDSSAIAVDLQNNVVPLRILKNSEELSQQFPATGITSNDGKATGTITIYNKLSPATPLTLIAGTHFLSDSGKYFVTLKRVTVPAMSGKNPGSIKVDVQAESVGSDYNIGASKFSVPKLSGTSYYYGIWAESTQAMTGGHTGKVKQVTQDDLDSAEDVLTNKVLSNAQNAIKSKVSDDEILLEGALSSRIDSSEADVKAKAIVDQFQESAKATASALVFKKQDMTDLLKSIISSQLQDGTSLLDSSLQLSYTIDSINVGKGTMIIVVSATAESYPTIDLSNLTDMFSGKSSDEISNTVNYRYGKGVSNVKVKFWPFWVQKAPQDKSRINVNLNFNK